jgi:hypothetical protein
VAARVYIELLWLSTFLFDNHGRSVNKYSAIA